MRLLIRLNGSGSGGSSAENPGSANGHRGQHRRRDASRSGQGVRFLRGERTRPDARDDERRPIIRPSLFS